MNHRDTTLGYIEAKDIGKPLDREGKSKQVEQYIESFDNLLLTKLDAWVGVYCGWVCEA